MAAFQIFGLQFAMSLVVYALLAAWYVAPRLAPLPLDRALPPLLFLHAFRHLGMVFLVPTVVGPSLQPEFAVPAAYGDLLAAFLALAAIVALRSGATVGVPLAWLFNLVGTLDLLYALYRGARLQVLLGAAYYIPTFVVPALLITHAMMFIRLIRRSR
jgi:hypothetical protein